MSRELKRDLFDDLLPPARTDSSFLNVNLQGSSETNSALQEDWHVLLAQFDLFKRRFKELESRQENTQNRMSEWMESTKVRFDRFNSAGSRMEQFLKQTIHEINEKFAQLNSRVTERRLQESKIQEMMDRHNQVLQTYDVRMGQIQKIVHEQELQLMGAKASLEEARREIARLKKFNRGSSVLEMHSHLRNPSE
jgi:chromosome segregation ATPase